MPVVDRTPYRNLILTGTIGVGKTGVGRQIAKQMDDAEFVDLEVLLEQREGRTAQVIRETFGMARLRTLERGLIEEMSLRRSSIVAVSGFSLLAPANLATLAETGPVLCLTAALGEILRRQHIIQGGQFHQSDARAALLGRLKRERDVLTLDLHQLDTTRLSVDDVAKQAIAFWREQSDI